MYLLRVGEAKKARRSSMRRPFPPERREAVASSINTVLGMARRGHDVAPSSNWLSARKTIDGIVDQEDFSGANVLMLLKGRSLFGARFHYHESNSRSEIPLTVVRENPQRR